MWGRRQPRHHQVAAVDDAGLEALLRELGVLDSIGETARCVRCGDLISLDSIEAIYPEDGEVRFVCNSGKCSTAFVTPDDR